MCGMHRNYVGAVERAESTLSIVATDELTKGLGIIVSGMFSELDCESRAHPTMDDRVMLPG